MGMNATADLWGKSLENLITMPLIYPTPLLVSAVGEMMSFTPSLVGYTVHIDRNA